jgi:hypothetical protein
MGDRDSAAGKGNEEVGPVVDSRKPGPASRGLAPDAGPGKPPDGEQPTFGDVTMAMMAIVQAAAAECGRCSTPVIRPWRYCPGCGSELVWEAPPAPAAEAPA